MYTCEMCVKRSVRSVYFISHQTHVYGEIFWDVVVKQMEDQFIRATWIELDMCQDSFMCMAWGVSVCAYVYESMYLCVCMCVYVYVHTRAREHVCAIVCCMHVCLIVCSCVFMCVHVCVCVYVCVCVCVYVCVNVCVCECGCVYMCVPARVSVCACLQKHKCADWVCADYLSSSRVCVIKNTHSRKHQKHTLSQTHTHIRANT